jgi:hypothetical protein
LYQDKSGNPGFNGKVKGNVFFVKFVLPLKKLPFRSRPRDLGKTEAPDFSRIFLVANFYFFRKSNKKDNKKSFPLDLIWHEAKKAEHDFWLKLMFFQNNSIKVENYF